MTYEVSEVALAAPSRVLLPGRQRLRRAPASCPPSTASGMLSFRELDAQREKLGVQVLFDCHDERLIQNPETKEIVGAYTMIGSEEKTVKARKGVIMTTGGFEFNEDLKNAYLKCYPFQVRGLAVQHGRRHQDGAERGRASCRHMNNIIGSYNAYFKDFEWPYAFTVTPGANNYVMLDRLGKRWIAESTVLEPACGMARIRKVQRLDARRLRAHSHLGDRRPRSHRCRAARCREGRCAEHPRRFHRHRHGTRRHSQRVRRIRRLERRQPNRNRKGLDHQSRHPRRALHEDGRRRQRPGRRIGSSHARNVQRILRRRKRPCIRSNRRHARARLARRPVLRLAPVPRRLLHARRPEK